MPSFWQIVDRALGEKSRAALAPGRGRYPLSPVVEDIVRRRAGLAVSSPRLKALDRLVGELGRTQPDWPRLAMQALAHGGGSKASPTAADAAAALLAARDLTDPGLLTDALVSPGRLASADRRRCLIALLGTGGHYALAAWRAELGRALSAAGDLEEERRAFLPVAFLCLLKLALERVLEYEDFRRAALIGRALDPDGYGGHRLRADGRHPALDFLGIRRWAGFASLYDRLAEEVASAGWHRLSWVRRFPGERYLHAGLGRIEEDGPSAEALALVRWARGTDDGRQMFLRRLATYRPETLIMLSILRRDLWPLIAEAAEWPGHEEVMGWLTRSCQAPPDSLRESIVAWEARCGSAFDAALDALGRMPVPAGARERGAVSFLKRHLAPHLGRVIGGQAWVWALSGRRLDNLARRAAGGEVAAITACAQVADGGDRWARLLLRAARQGTRPVAAAAEQALAIVAACCGLDDWRELERRLDLALAWDDQGLEGAPARVWWDIAGHRIKLTIVRGRAEVAAFGPRGPKASVPREVRADPAYAEVKDARKALSRQYAHFRDRLEGAMVEATSIPARTLALLLRSPVVANLAARIVWLADDDRAGVIDEGLLRDAAGSIPLGQLGSLTIAHPCALIARGLLDQWREWVIRERCTQPFKQVWRETYLPDEDEQEATESSRFAGHPVLARQAFAVLRSRGWAPGSGDAVRDWAGRDLRARFTWATGVEAIHRHLRGPLVSEPVITGRVRFTRIVREGGKWREDEPLAMGEVDPIVFSETMRAADLVVSCAAAGDEGFSSRETVQLRAALIRGMARAMGLTNVWVAADDAHAIVDGRGGMYRIHLASGTVLREPDGRHVPIRPPRRRDDFLPAEQADSRTGDILSLIPALIEGEGVEVAAG